MGALRAVLLSMAAGAMLAAGAAAIPPDMDAALATALASNLKFSPQDLNELSRGRLIAHTLPVSNSREVAVVGAVRVNAAVVAMVDRVRDIVRFKQSPDVLQIGKFSSPPAAEDLAPLVVTPRDADLRGCRVGRCDVRLSADAIRRIQQEVDWRAPDAQARAAAVFKSILIDDVRAYVSGGGGRMSEYVDGDDPIRPMDDFQAVLKASPMLAALAPALPAHLAEFPAAAAPGVEDFLYWSKEKFGLDPFITVTHVSIARGADGTYVITSKDVYSSRYLDASLGTTIASEARGEPQRFYLVYVTRTRAHALGGAFSGVRHAIAERRARSALEQNLRAARVRIERGQ